MGTWSMHGSCCRVLVEACRFGGLSKVCPRSVGKAYYLGGDIRRHDAKLIAVLVPCVESCVMHTLVRPSVVAGAVDGPEYLSSQVDYQVRV